VGWGDLSLRGPIGSLEAPRSFERYRRFSLGNRPWMKQSLCFRLIDFLIPPLHARGQVVGGGGGRWVGGSLGDRSEGPVRADHSAQIRSANLSKDVFKQELRLGSTKLIDCGRVIRSRQILSDSLDRWCRTFAFTFQSRSHTCVHLTQPSCSSTNVRTTSPAYQRTSFLLAQP